jgi:N6-adenosine-specific RNA methylase IME4
MRNKIDSLRSTLAATCSPEPVATLRGPSKIKAAHRRRSRNPLASPKVLPVRPRPCFPIAQNADATNASLRNYIKMHGKADLGYIDAPWSMGRQTPTEHFGSVSPEMHYPTMSPRALLDFQFGEAFQKDAIVGFWALNGQMNLAIDMLRAQGFKVKTLVTWHKVRSRGGDAFLPATGPVRNCSEILIIAARGRGPPIDQAERKFPSVMKVERTEHSTKPGVFREVLTKLYPTTLTGRRVVRLELFARSSVPGWKAWGNQAPKQVGGKRLALRAA